MADDWVVIGSRHLDEMEEIKESKGRIQETGNKLQTIYITVNTSKDITAEELSAKVSQALKKVVCEKSLSEKRKPANTNRAQELARGVLEYCEREKFTLHETDILLRDITFATQDAGRAMMKENLFFIQEEAKK